MKSLICYLPLLFLLPLSCQGQKNASAETLEKIQQVENNIAGSLLLNDEQPVSIAERMAKYNVKGLSIAVIHDYKIAWAKG